MIEESGKVVALEGDYVWVETMREAACNACTAKSGCGQSVLEKAALGKKHRIRALSTLKVELGDEVVIGIEEPGSTWKRAYLCAYQSFYPWSKK